ncbi:MAG: hypothetical protein NW224_14725 [Leptolyngbyaceae cyanobacterium bins.302]|nr:hypothetical protein [Leptolyngbyaceae cyanobacterium bins.302]
MKTPLRLSPIHAALQALDGTWKTINGMPCLTAITTATQPSSQVEVMDLSCLQRFGVKGANAAEWLSQQGLKTPTGADLSLPELRPNSWQPLSGGAMIARLGLTEYLIEDSLSTTLAPRLAYACQAPPARVYPVLRQDLALGLMGDRLPDLLRQTCSFNFQALALSDRPIILTSMIGVAVTVLPSERSGKPFYRLWCDGTFGTYFWQTLMEIATELGGGAISTEFLL